MMERKKKDPEEVEVEAGEEEEAVLEQESEMVEDAPPEVQLAEMEDRLLRVSAEFENYKKRRQRDTQDLLKYGHEAMVRELLPVLDSFERAILSSEGTRDYDAFHDGILMIFQQFQEILNRTGVERISPEGEPFDPNWHEAVGVCEHDELEPEHVAVVIEPGYRLHDRVIRPAKVMVVRPGVGEKGSV